MVCREQSRPELIIDFRKNSADPDPLNINGDYIKRVPAFRFLGTLITEDLSWTTNTTAVVKTAQQRLHFPRILRENNLQDRLLSFYRCSTESVLYFCMVCQLLQRVVNAAQKIVSCSLPSVEDLFSSRCLSRAAALKDPSHPGHHLFELLPSGRCFRSIKSQTNRLLPESHSRTEHSQTLTLTVWDLCDYQHCSTYSYIYIYISYARAHVRFVSNAT